MVEKKGLGRALSHAVLLFGAAIVLFPLYVALVATSHSYDVLIGSTPLWFGGELIKNFTTVLTQGLKAAGGIPVWVMMSNSLIMALGIALGKRSEDHRNLLIALGVIGCAERRGVRCDEMVVGVGSRLTGLYVSIDNNRIVVVDKAPDYEDASAVGIGVRFCEAGRRRDSILASDVEIDAVIGDIRTSRALVCDGFRCPVAYADGERAISGGRRCVIAGHRQKRG